MDQKIVNRIGWMLLIVLGVSWIVVGYSNWYLLLLPLTYLAFSISDGRIKKLANISVGQLILILFTWAAAVGIIFGLIQGANFLITDILHLTGTVKDVTQIIAIILSLYPIKILFGIIVHKVLSDSNANDS